MVRGATFSPDGTTLASGGWDKVLRLWEYPSCRLKASFSLPGEADFHEKTYYDPRIECVAYSPDGRLLATWHLDGSVCLWNAVSGRVLNKFKGYQGQGRALAFSPNGLWLACVGENHAVWIVEPRSGQVVLRLRGHQGRVSGVAFAPNGRCLLSGSRDNTALLWSLRPPQPTSPWNLETPWEELGSADASAAYRALWRLAEKPDEGLSLLQQRLKPIQAVPADTIRSLVADLDANSFKRREEATKRLREIGEEAASGLREALQAKPTAEQRRRVEGLLAELDAGHISNEVTRHLRAIAVLEQIGLPKSREVLQQLAAGASSAALTRQARAALARTK